MLDNSNKFKSIFIYTNRWYNVLWLLSRYSSTPHICFNSSTIEIIYIFRVIFEMNKFLII